jgi:hypothetical protein
VVASPGLLLEAPVPAAEPAVDGLGVGHPQQVSHRHRRAAGHPEAGTVDAGAEGGGASTEARRKMSAAQRRRGTRPPKAGRPWTAEEDALVRALPAKEVAARTGRTLGAVHDRRRILGMPDGRTRAAKQ